MKRQFYIAKNLVLIGMPASLKTTAGMRASEKLSMIFGDTDEIFVFEYAMSIEECFSSYGEEVFRKYEGKIIGHLSECEGVVIATGGGAIKDPKNVERLRQNGVIIWLKASAQNIFERVSKTNDRPLLKDCTLADIERLLTEREPLYAAAAHATIETDGLSVEEIADSIVAQYNLHKSED